MENVESTTEQEETTNPSQQETNTPSEKVGNFTITGYMVGDGFTPSTVTATGVNVAGGNVLTPRGYRVLAVNTGTYSYGTILRITLPNGTIIIGEAADTGYLATNQIDVLVSGQGELQSLIGGKVSGASVQVVN